MQIEQQRNKEDVDRTILNERRCSQNNREIEKIQIEQQRYKEDADRKTEV